MATPPIPDEKLKALVDLWEKLHRNTSHLAAALKLPRTTVAHQLDNARRRNLIGVPPKPRIRVKAGSAPVGAPIPELDAVDGRRGLDERAVLRQRVAALERRIIAEEAWRQRFTSLHGTADEPVDWLPTPTIGRQNSMIPVLFTSDFQCGEVIRPEEIDGINAYNQEIFIDRYQRMIEKTVDLARNCTGATDFPYAIYLRGGDAISGEIHEELAQTNDLSSVPALRLLQQQEREGIRKLRSEFGRVRVISIPGNHGRCYDDETECLTDQGWKYIQDIHPHERIAIYKPDTDELLFETPSDWYVGLYEGDMVKLKNKGTDLLVTPEHTLWVRRGWKGTTVNGKHYKYDFSKRKAKENSWGKGWSHLTAPALWRGIVGPLILPRSPKRKGFIIYPNENWAKLFGWYVSEGNTDKGGRITISQSAAVNPQKYAAICKLISDLGFNARLKPKMVRFNCSPLAHFLSSQFGDVSGNKRLPKWLRDWPKKLLTAFMEAAYDGDGHRETAAYWKYCSKSDDLIDNMQEVALKCGYFTNSCSAREYTKCGPYFGSARRLGITTMRERAMPKAETVPYSGVIWCPTVSTGLLFVRRRGRVTISGNTTHKPRSKGYTERSYETLLSWWLADTFEGDPNVTFYTPKSGEALFEVAGWNWLMAHGDRMGSKGGKGFIGPSATIARGHAKLYQNWAATGRRLDLILTGHLHTSVKLERGYANGSIAGYSEFARDIQALPDTAKQWLLFAHEKHMVSHAFELVLSERPQRMPAFRNVGHE